MTAMTTMMMMVNVLGDECRDDECWTIVLMMMMMMIMMMMVRALPHGLHAPPDGR